MPGQSRANQLRIALCIVVSTAPIDARAEPDPASIAAEPRLYADAFAVWIYKAPRRSRTPIGYLRGGQSARLRDESAASFEQCPGGWYAVEPLGFVCEERGVSLTPTRYNRAMRALAPAPGAFPFHYGVSLGTPAYRRLPTAREFADLGATSNAVATAPWPEPDVLTRTVLPLSEPSWFLHRSGSVAESAESRLVRREVPPLTLLSLTARFEADGTSYYQVADGTVVPSDRLHLFRRSDFAGLTLDAASSLPLGWPRTELATRTLSAKCAAVLGPQLERSSNPGRLARPLAVKRRCMDLAPERLSARVPVLLSGRRLLVGGRPLVETKSGQWVDQASLYLATQRAPNHVLSHSAEKWIHFSIQQGTLVAYEGTTPVFATLASPGSGEVTSYGTKRLTPTGTFRINFKHVTDDMSREAGEHRSEWKADVPFAMYFQQPYGIHVAYWHEAFGEPKSGGCVNVSPLDGARLFDWTEPHLPPDWYGVGSGAELGLGTVVHITP